MTGTVVHLDPIAHARAVKARLWNPKNASQSSDLDIVPGAAFRKLQAERIKHQTQATRDANEALRRELLLDAGMRNAVEDRALARKIAAQIEEEETREPPKIRTIIDFVAAKFDVRTTDILSERKMKHIIWPRFVAMYLARRLTFRSTSEIGRRIGRRDHTTVIHATRRVEERMQADVQFKENVDDYQRELVGAGI